MGQCSQGENMSPTFFAFCPFTTFSVCLWPLRTQMCPFCTFPPHLRTLNKPFQSLWLVRWKAWWATRSPLFCSRVHLHADFSYLIKSHPPYWRNNVILISEGSELSSVAPSPFICPFFISFLYSCLRINDSGDANINYSSYGYHLLSACHDPGSGTNYWHSEISFDLTIPH